MILTHLFLPAAAVSLLIYGPLIRSMNRTNFYFGEPSIVPAIRSVSRAAFVYTWNAHVPEAFHAVFYRLAENLTETYVWVILLLVVTGCAMAPYLLRANPSKGAILFVLASAATFGDFMLAVAAHHAGGVLYPLRRTGLHWMLESQIVLVAFYACFFADRRPMARVASVAAALFLCAICVDFAAFVDAGFYREWPGGALMKTMVRRIDSARAGLPEPIIVGGTGIFEASLNFYRVSWKLNWMAPVERRPLGNPAHFYVLDEADRAAMGAALEILVEDPEWHTCLARRASRANGMRPKY